MLSEPIPARHTEHGLISCEDLGIPDSRANAYLTELGFGGHSYWQEWPTLAAAIAAVELLGRIEEGELGKEEGEKEERP